MTRFTLSLLVVLSLSARAEEATVELPARYREIVDRFPFGEPPAGFDPMAKNQTLSSEAGGAGVEATPEIPLSQQQEALLRSVTASVIVIDPVTREPWVGFTDATDPTPGHARNYYLPVGQTQNGWTVREVDLAKKSVKIARGEVEVDLAIGAPPERRPSSVIRGQAGGRAPVQTNLGRSPLLTTVSTGGSPVGGMSRGSADSGSLQSLRRQRREQENERLKQIEDARQASLSAAEEVKRQQEELQKQREQERAQREAEREADRQAEREEYLQRMRNLQEELEKKMSENRQRETGEGENE